MTPLRTKLFTLKEKIKYKKAYAAQVALAEKGSMIHLICGGTCKSGENLRLRANTSLVAIGGEISLGSDVFFNRNCNLVCRERVVVGDHVSFGHNVCIIDHDHKFSAAGASPSEYKTGEIVIEEGCWIGAGAIILRGTRIGAHSVIGAGCIVHGEIPAHSLVKGERSLSVTPLQDK